MNDVTVLDTSVVIPWFVDGEPSREKALAVREDFRDRPMSYVVPQLFFSEFLHAVSRRSGHDVQFVSSALSILLRIGLRAVPLTDDALAHAAAWSCRGLSGYDATFVGLAQDLKCRWLTSDEKAAAIVGKRVAQRLSTWSAPGSS